MSQLAVAKNFHTVSTSELFPDHLPAQLPSNFRSINLTIEDVPSNFSLQNLNNQNSFLKDILSSGPFRIKKGRFKIRTSDRGARLPSDLKQRSLFGPKSGSRRKSISNSRPAGKPTLRTRFDTDAPMSNATLGHLQVLWAALSVALGVEVKGELIRGLPCITRFNQLFCRSGGTSYPSKKIEQFIDDNKALIRRMHGEFISLSLLSDNIRSGRKKRSIYAKPLPEEEYFDLPKKDFPNSANDIATEGSFLLQNTSKDASEDNPYVNVYRRTKRQASSRTRSRSNSPGPLPKSERDRVDACQSEEEVATPYWASNSRGKILAIVNTKEFSQIIHQEICTTQSTKRCNNDCGCEQKYKYHRLMAYDPDNDCKGIFMDWFLFPSCCSCRCDPL